VRAPSALLPSLLFVRLADEWFTFFPAGALEPIRADVGLAYADVGLVLTALTAGGLLGNGFAAAADFVDRRRLASGGALVYALCLIAFAVGDALPVLLVAGFVWGAASDAFAHSCEVALVDLYRDDVAPALGQVNAYGAVGDLLGPLSLAGAAATGLGWRGAFAAGAALMLLYAGWLAARPFPAPRPRPGAATPAQAVLGVVRDRRIILLAVVDGLFGLLDEPFWGFTVAFLERERGLAPAAATAVVGVAVAAGIAGFLSVPAFTGRWAPAWLLVRLGAVLAAAVAALIALPLAPLQLAAAATFGFTGAVFYAVLQATYLALRPGQAGTSKAVVSTIGCFGIGVPTLVGAVADAYGLTAGLAVYGAVPIAIVLLLAAAPPRSAPRAP
jgi:predicted MFS family arabinose efflux permease